MIKNRTTPTAPPAMMPFATALVELERQIVPVRERLAELVSKQLALEGNTGLPPKGARIAREGDHQQQAALKLLLNGNAPHPQMKQSWSEIVKERATCERALEIGDRLFGELRIKARAELGEAHLAEHQALMKQKAQALLGLERIEQAIDANAKGTDLVGYPLRGLGRLTQSASALYVCLEQFVRLGYLNQRTFDEELARARKAAER